MKRLRGIKDQDFKWRIPSKYSRLLILTIGRKQFSNFMNTSTVFDVQKGAEESRDSLFLKKIFGCGHNLRETVELCTLPFKTGSKVNI